MIDEVRYCDKNKELIEIGFRPAMCLNNDDANELYEHMIENNMIFLKKSYGTIINKDYTMFFKKAISSARKYSELWERGYGYGIDHKNILRAKDYGFYILTSSPYREVFSVKLNVPACQVFLINPLFLDYYGFMGNTNYGCNIAYVYDKYIDDFNNLKEEMKEYYGFNVFVKLGE